MANPLAGKVALVTAGSAGLGAAIVAKLAASQMRVVVNYSSNAVRASELIKTLADSNLDLTESDVAKLQPRFLVIKADLSKRSDIIRLVDETVAAMGQLDVVVSNGGWTRFSNFADLDEGVVESDWDQCFNMNVKSHLFLMHAAKEHLDLVEGAFISTSSVAGVKPSGSSLVGAFCFSLCCLECAHDDYYIGLRRE
ncbi:hypothetical protein MMC08_006808 [Hypocenomyce scalaris]|nr:hypothetical protein [Hypocenomyce scalaris]